MNMSTLMMDMNAKGFVFIVRRNSKRKDEDIGSRLGISQVSMTQGTRQERGEGERMMLDFSIAGLHPSRNPPAVIDASLSAGGVFFPR